MPLFANIKLLKAALTGLIEKYAQEKKRQKLNSERNNNIQSTDVDVQALKGDHTTILKGSYVCGNSSIGSYNYIGFNTLITKTTIGRYNSIASNINIGHGEHPLHHISTSSFINNTPYETLTEKPCTIEHDVWIGAGATIRRGVTLGTGSVIGANAFVNKDVPPFAVVGGAPATIIKYRFPPEKIEQILASNWWEYDLEQARSIIQELEKNT